MLGGGAAAGVYLERHVANLRLGMTLELFTAFGALLGGTWHLLRNELEPAGLLIEELIAKAPRMPMPRLMRAELLTRGNANIAVRKQAYRDLLRLQPGNTYAQAVMRTLEAAERASEPAAFDGWSTSVAVGAGL